MQPNTPPSLRRLFAGIAIGVVVGVALGAVAAWKSAASVVFDSDAFQAVFLTNNQVYFGKLSGLGSRYPVLSDVYYIQAATSQDLTSGAKSGEQLQLVKLGSELHQPQNIMYLNREQILFIEPLKPDSQIVKSIADFQRK